MYKAHKIRLYPTISQEVFFKKSCGVARFAYNWALNKWQEKHKSGEDTSVYPLIKELTKIKREEYPWMMDVGKTCPQYAIHNLGHAYNNFFKKAAKYPRFKKKGQADSFIAVENNKHFNNNQKDFKIKIPRLGWVRCAENIRFEGKVNHIAIKRIADYWFAIVNMEVNNEISIICKNQAIIGVDLGIKSMMVLSDGTTFDNPKALVSNMKHLKRLQRSLSRKLRGSNNYKKQQIKVSKKHYGISCIRNNAIHRATTTIVNKYSVIVVEDLNVKGMLKNHNLSRSISDVSFGEIRRQLSYKSIWYGKELIIADRFYASSKICSCCGYKKETLKLSERIFSCEICGMHIDRDLNASKNLANYGSTAKFAESNASGESSSINRSLFSDSMKEELGNKLITI